MKAEKTTRLAASMADIAALCPSVRLGDESRLVVLADLRMGDGGKKDRLARSGKALFSVLGRWYLPRGYTLVLNGDIEDIRNFWLKDILAAWPKMYALFDAFKEDGGLRKIAGDRDLGLLRLRSYPYELSHGLRLDLDDRSLLVLHGHQASPPYLGRDYLSDYIVHWLGSSKRPKPEEADAEGRLRFEAERRLYRAASSLGIVAIQGHTRRPLFESRTNRESIRAEVERLLREEDPRKSGSKVDEDRSLVLPCLFSPGRVLGAKVEGSRALRMLEIRGGSLRMVRWTAEPRVSAARRGETATPGSNEASKAEAESIELGGKSYSRVETRSAPIRGLFERISLLG